MGNLMMYINNRIIELTDIIMILSITIFPGGANGKNLGDVRDAGSIPGSGRSPGGGHGHPLQYSCWENPVDRGAWWTVVHRVAKIRTRLK